MKTKWQFLVFSGLALLVASLVVGCAQKLTPPIITEFSANPDKIDSSESTTLLWNVTDANTITIDPGIGNVAKQGTQLVSPHATTAYTLTAANDVATVTKSVVITVIPPEESEEEDHEPSPAQEPIHGELKVHFIDVEQGDSILVDLDETEILIDGGDKSPGIVQYLHGYVDGVLEAMVATHPHADHIGGLIEVLDTFEVGEIWLNGDTSTSGTYTEFMLAVNSEGAPVYEARRGDTIETNDLTFNVLHPANLNDTINNNSIVLSFSYGEVDFLFTGDAEHEAEISMLAEGIVPNVEILKIGHHGSRTSSSSEFLQVAKPECAICMVGKDNTYGHPHQETITKLCDIATWIYGTDIAGTITITTRGTLYYIQCEIPLCYPCPPTVTLPPPANFTVSNLHISPEEVEAGETVTIEATVTNSGGSPGNYDTILKINGSEVERKGVVLDAGESQKVYFTGAIETIGTYTVDINGLVGIFTVIETTSKPSFDCTCYSYTLDRFIPCEQATAICRDGTCSVSKSRRGTCSWHGGVARWID